ncbi:formylglycine-generating enzyme family protein [Runella slithyformis]|nr:formylglycine-generating enzyme family protein [Runella slithyformis]
MSRIFAFLLSVTALVYVLSSCGTKTDTHQHSAPPAQTVEVNTDFLKNLKFPPTILYAGLEKPTDTTVSTTKPKTVPTGMIYIQGGVVQIGSDEGLEQERPSFWAKVNSFWMDTHPVTVGEFRKFVQATHFQTEAEKFGNAGIIDESTDRQWILKDGANWHHPMGPDFPAAADDHPVTQVSWNDANAYAQWAGKRLPCELEWEHAARNARNSRSIYPWGNDIQTKGQYNANIWQGKFPVKNANEDGFAYTSPVGKFGKTPLGLTDMSGNVWEWQSNLKFNYEALFRTGTRDGDLSAERAQRGGSFLCEPGWCHGYRVSGRSSSTSETSLFHVGFRCVKDVE